MFKGLLRIVLRLDYSLIWVLLWCTGNQLDQDWSISNRILFGSSSCGTVRLVESVLRLRIRCRVCGFSFGLQRNPCRVGFLRRGGIYVLGRVLSRLVRFGGFRAWETRGESRKSRDRTRRRIDRRFVCWTFVICVWERVRVTVLVRVVRLRLGFSFFIDLRRRMIQCLFGV